jgi:hypothetical protein
MLADDSSTSKILIGFNFPDPGYMVSWFDRPFPALSTVRCGD